MLILVMRLLEVPAHLYVPARLMPAGSKIVIYPAKLELAK